MAQPQPPLAPETRERRIVLYDGECGFCDGLVRWLIDRDPGARFRYAPLQGSTSAELRARHAEIPVDVDTVVYVEQLADGERVFLRSAAIFEIFGQLGAPWRWLAALRVLPRPLSDAAYRLFARYRYRLFGRLEECRIPSPQERARFLD